MKRGWIILFALLFAIPYAFASISVTLHTPGTFTTSTAILNCTGLITTAEEGNLGATAELLMSTGSTLELNQTISVPPQTNYDASFTVNNVPNGVYNWNCRFYNQTADNSVNATGTQGTFTVSVTAANTAPSFNLAIPNQSFAEDGSSSNAFDLDSHFSDSETASLNYSVFGNTTLQVTIASSGQVSFSSTGNASFNETIYFVASDGSQTNRSNNLIVNAYSVNDAPYLKSQIPTQNLTKNTNHTITLSDYFADADGDSLTYTVLTAPVNINVTISGGSAILTPAANWSGNNTIAFTANDSKATTNSNTFTLSMSGNATVANAPSITDYSPLIDTVTIEAGGSRTFSIVKSNGNDTVKWYLNDNEIAGVTGDSYQLSDLTNGSYTLKVIVSNSYSTAQKTWAVTVTEAVKLNFTAPTKVETKSILPTSEAKSKPVCGNGVIEPGEDCSTCIEDVRCALDEICINAGCEKKKAGSSLLIIVAIIGAVIAILVFLLYKLNASRRFDDHAREEGPRSSALSSKTELKPASEIKDFYHKNENTEKAKPIHNEVEELRKKGLTDQEIISQLKSKGWPQWQIEMKLKGK